MLQNHISKVESYFSDFILKLQISFFNIKYLHLILQKNNRGSGSENESLVRNMYIRNA